MVKTLIGFIFICLAAVSADAADGCGTVTAQAAVSGDRLILADGTSMRLALIKAPEYWPEGAAYGKWPHADAARDRLAQLAVGQPLSLACNGQYIGHDDSPAARLVAADGSLIQEMLLREGQVFLFSRPEDRAVPEILIAAEQAARQGRKGLWAYDAYALQDAATPASIQAGRFQFVAGTILDTAKVRDTVYLNFGPDWRTDFTVELDKAAQRRFKKADIDPLALKGKRIEVRGWVDYKGGPRLLVEGPGQLIIFGAKTD